MSQTTLDANKFLNDNRSRLRVAMQLALDSAPHPSDRAYWRSAIRSFDRVEGPQPTARQAMQPAPNAGARPAAVPHTPVHHSVRQTCHLTMPTAALSLPTVISAIAADTKLSPEIVKTGQGGTARAQISRDVSPASPGLVRITAHDVAYGIMSETETTLEQYGVCFDAFAPGDGDRSTNVRWLRDTMDETRTADVDADGMGVSFPTIDKILAQTNKAQTASSVRSALYQQRPHFEYLDDPIGNHATQNASMKTAECEAPGRRLSSGSSME